MNTQLDLFYNTINLTGSDLRRREIRAGTQNAKILEWFRQHPDQLFTPFDVWHNVSVKEPLTSYRRAMTTLTKLGYLEKTILKKKGEYDMDNYCWKLA